MQAEIDVRRFESTDPNTVSETWREFAPSAELLGISKQHCRFEWTSIATSAVSLIRYELAANVRSTVAPEDQFFTCKVTTRSGGVEAGGRRLGSGALWASDGPRVNAQWGDAATVQAMVFERARAERIARQILGDDGFRLRLKRFDAVSPQAAQQWDLALRYLSSALALERAGSARTPSLVTAGLERHAFWTALSAFSTSFEDVMHRPAQTRAAPVTVRRAISFMESNAHLPITIDDVAAASHISTRGLQYAFKRALNQSPSEFLRKARLAGARSELQRATPERSLASIALDWGFANVTRFTALYLAEYGEHPAEVLKRSR